MTASTVPSVQVFEGFPQELTIDVLGPDVLLFASNRPKADPAPEEAIPDPVELFVGAVNQQMFPRAREGRCVSGARILGRSADLARGAQSWRLRIEDAHPACFRVLVNLLAARELDTIEVRGSPPPSPGRKVDPVGVAYPPARAQLPFPVEHEEVIRALRDRFIQIEFANPPSDQLVDGLSAVLALWCDILLFGGYPPEDMEARESGVMPDGPIVLDETTVQMAFPDAFHADDAAFNCMLNHLYCVSQQGTPVALVRIR